MSFFGGVLNGRPCGGKSWIPVVFDDEGVDVVVFDDDDGFDTDDDDDDDDGFDTDTDDDDGFDDDDDDTFATAEDAFWGRRDDLTGRVGRENCSPYSIETGFEEKGFGVDTDDMDLGKMRAGGFASRTGFTSRTGLGVVESVIT